MGRQRGSPPRPRSAPGRGGLGSGRFAPAWGAEVVSSNIVGYEKITLSTGFNAIGVQFVQVGGSTLPLDSVGTLDAGIPGVDEEGEYSTEMQVWNGNGYDYYAWSGTGMGDNFDSPELDNKWLNLDLEDHNEMAPAGSAFWIKAGAAGTMTISGQVPDSDTMTADIAAGFNLVGNPYPGTVSIFEFGKLSSDFAGIDEEGEYSTEMQVWNGNGYDYYVWSGTGMGDNFDSPELDNKWLNLDLEEPTGETVAFGHAVWIKAPNAGTITFTAPTSAGN